MASASASAAPAAPPHVHPHGQRPPPLGPFNADRKHSEPERWICIYPAYINSNKSRAEGRLLPKSSCALNPTYLEIRDVLMSAGVQDWRPLIEAKSYPRERSREIEFRGRIRVQIRRDDGELLDERFPNRTAILRYLGEKIPQLKSRTTKQTSGQEHQQGQGGKKGKKKK